MNQATTTPWRARRVASWAALATAALALIATSAPETAVLQDNLTVDGGTASLLLTVNVNEDGVDEADGMELSVQVSIDATQQGAVSAPLVELVPDDASLPVATPDLQRDGDRWEGSALVRFRNACPEDEPCTQRFTLEVPDGLSYNAEIVTRIFEEDTGCAISNPSFDDDADVSISSEEL